jgi:translation initiation factor 5A
MEREEVYEQEQFESADAGASKTYPVQCSALRKNGFVVLNGRPCKIVEMSTSKTGKHGHAKVNITAIDIFTSKKYEDMCPSTHNMDVPVVRRSEVTLVDIDDDNIVHVMMPDGSIESHLRLPEGDLGKNLRETFENEGEKTILVTIQEAMGEEAIIQFKETEK